MKKLTLIFTLLFTVLLSAPSYAEWKAEWKKVGKNMIGDTFYVDFERIRKHGGYVYWWDLSDYLKPTHGDLSVKTYKQSDCKLFRYMRLSSSFHKEPMGRGTPSNNYSNKNPYWIYPSPNSVSEQILKSVCSR